MTLLLTGANKVFKKKPWAALERERHEKDRSESEESKRLARALRSALYDATPTVYDAHEAHFVTQCPEVSFQGNLLCFAGEIRSGRQQLHKPA